MSIPKLLLEILKELTNSGSGNNRPVLEAIAELRTEQLRQGEKIDRFFPDEDVDDPRIAGLTDQLRGPTDALKAAVEANPLPQG